MKENEPKKIMRQIAQEYERIAKMVEQGALSSE